MTEQILKKELPTSLERARMAARLIVDDKGEDVKILDLREITQAFDFFVIASGQSRRQLHSISDDIDDLFEKKEQIERLEQIFSKDDFIIKTTVLI